MSHTIRTDLRDIVEQALQLHALQPGDTVVDIGCNDGTLLGFYPDWVTRIGVDPLAKFEQEVTSKGIHFIIDYFNARSFKERFERKKPTIITAISMFYDLDKPNEFLRDVCEILDESGILVIQQNYLISMVENNAFDNICHEHLEYYSLSTLRFLLIAARTECFPCFHKRDQRRKHQNFRQPGRRKAGPTEREKGR